MEIIKRKTLKEKPAKGTSLGFGHYFTEIVSYELYVAVVSDYYSYV